jgi:DNA repair protein RadC
MSAEPPLPAAAPVPHPAALAELAGLRVETPAAPVARPAPVIPNRLLGLATGQRPRERALSLGVAALDDLELTALILRSGTSGLDVLTLAERLLAEAGSLHALARWREPDFRRLKGIGKVKAVQLCTVFEITRRVLGAERSLAPELSDPESIYAYLRPRAFGLEVEKCWVLTLNSRNRLLRCAELTSGTANQTLVRTAEVLREAVREAAAGFVLAHNHPSGDPEPSSADLRITRQLRSAADTLEIRLHDHLILGDPAIDRAGLGYYSFKRGGHL